MGVLATLSEAFVGVCRTVAVTVSTVTEWVGFILHLNYTIVTTIYGTVCDVLSVMFAVLDYIMQTVVVVLVYVVDFLYEVYGCVCALLVFFWRVLVLLYKILCFLLTCVDTIVLGVWNGGVFTLKTLKQSAADVADTCESTTDYLAMLSQESIAYICNIFTSVGNFAAAVVQNAWIGIGYVPAAIASMPGHIADWVERVWTRFTMWTAEAFEGVTKETYLGMLVVCLLYMLLTRIVMLMHAKGMTFFFCWRNSHTHSARRSASRNMYGVDRGFESDANDGDDDEDDNNDASGDEDSDDSESETHSELTLNDNSDGHSAESDSDVSLNSQTFSSEESDHEIDVELPTAAENYSLRSRSSTPSRISGKDMTHEQFEQELERERDKRKCVVCQDANKSVLILPCKHMCLCVLCADQIVRLRFVGRRICPLCRTRIERVINVYV